MLDQIRRDIQTRLDQLLSEADRLRHALTILGGRDGSHAHASRDGNQAPPPRNRSTPTAGTSTRNRTASQGGDQTPRRAQSDGASHRTAPGATKTAVLAALASGDAMTAGEVADATGLGRASVSTTLSKLAKTGEISKATRGYQIAGQMPSSAAVDGARAGARSDT